MGSFSFITLSLRSGAPIHKLSFRLHRKNIFKKKLIKKKNRG